MKAADLWLSLFSIFSILLSVSLQRPELLDDNNLFLKGFVNHELLGTLGFIVAVTLASASNLHIELNKLQDEVGKPFSRARNSLKKSVYTLLLLFGAAVVLVVIKPMLPTNGYGESVALLHSGAIVILFFNLSVLYQLTKAVFAIPPVSSLKKGNGSTH